VLKNGVETLHGNINALERKRLSHHSLLDELMQWSRALRKSMAEILRTPVFSTAIGWKRYCSVTLYPAGSTLSSPCV